MIIVSTVSPNVSNTKRTMTSLKKLDFIYRNRNNHVKNYEWEVLSEYE